MYLDIALQTMVTSASSFLAPAPSALSSLSSSLVDQNFDASFKCKISFYNLVPTAGPGGEAAVSKTAQTFAATMKKLSKNPSTVSFIISAGFEMTETCAGCIYDPVDVLATEPAHEFPDLGCPINGCEMRIIDPADGATLHPDGESGKLQVQAANNCLGRHFNNGVRVLVLFLDCDGIVDITHVSISDANIDDFVLNHIAGVLWLVFKPASRYFQQFTTLVYGVLQRLGGTLMSNWTQLSGALAGTVFAVSSFTQRCLQPSFSALHHLISSLSSLNLPTQTKVTDSEAQLLDHLISLFKQGGLTKHIARAEELLNEARSISFVTPSTEMEKALAKIYAQSSSCTLVSEKLNILGICRIL
ncbi:uncharacterized protein EDB91DRAFT_1087217 [Suillus paluster]|uniref:uncharacterized protein n=1 Tax=Suillus paluster TaxID=48578 RepID=UPI001B8772CF|nr:uncharacterized protein EDB91DRAFT_1087217 [Suillus paluster]KAG1725156.1 hypothetical protein EDB91DRAFT_1087217 [Suillus paluster]